MSMGMDARTRFWRSGLTIPNEGQLQFRGRVPPVTLTRFRTIDVLQSLIAVFRYESQALLTLSPT